MSASDIDRRAAAAAAQLRTAVAARSLPNAPAPRRSPWTPRLAVGAAFAVVAAVVLALTVPGGKSADPLALAPDGTPFWTADPPAGWRVTRFSADRSIPDPAQLPLVLMLATPAAPDGPVAVVTLDRLPGFSGPEGAGQGVTGFVESTVGGRRLVMADSAPDRRMAWVEVDGRWVSVLARGLDDAALTVVATGVTLGADGVPVVAALPAGLTVVGRGTPDRVSPAIAGSALADATSTTALAAADGASNVSLTAAPFSAADPAYVGLLMPDRRAVDVDGLRGWSGTMGEATRTLVWTDGEHTFVLYADPSATIDLVALAKTVRPAHRSDVDAVEPPTDEVSASPTTMAEITTTAASIVTSAPPVPSGVIEPVAVDVTVSTPNELVLRGGVDAQSTFAIDIAVVGDGVRFLPVGAAGAYGYSTFEVPEVGKTMISAAGGSATLFGGVAVSRDPAADRLVIMATDGRRWSAPLVAVPGRSDVRVATLMLPNETFANASVIAADGRELAAVAGPGPSTTATSSPGR